MQTHLIHFTNVGPNLANKIRPTTNKHFQNCLSKKHSDVFLFQNIDEKTINDIIDKLAPKTSFGFDGLSTKLIKTTKAILTKPITLIINQMLNTGIFPARSIKNCKDNSYLQKGG